MTADMILPLEALRSGDFAEIVDITGDPALVGRMAEMGLRSGCCFKLVQAGSPCVLQVAGCSLCLRGEQCALILVRPLAN